MKIKVINHKDYYETLMNLNEVYLKKDIGLIGDKNQKGDRQISILDYCAYREILNRDFRGLCTSRFYANLIIDDLNIDNLKIDDIWQIGQSIIQIRIIGKRCFKECGLFRNKGYCPLLKSVAFGKVIKDGIISVGDKVDLLRDG